MNKFKPTFPDYPHFLHGGDYNPEQWRDTPEIWDEDMRLMKLANCNEMTMGIFSWAELEPQEGVFDFSVLDTLMDKIYQNGGRVILATPSGARPHWLADKYPEVLRKNEDFVNEHFRTRHNHCPSSPVYREKVRIINETLARRYTGHPALIGWHLSNEYGGACYCEQCAEKFREWLKQKYGSIEELNRRWWTRFWSHRCDSFAQIEPPMPKVGETCVHGLNLDWKRFVSDITVDFMKAEIKAVRAFSDKPVTTNCMGFYQGLNYRDFAKELDFFSNDTYPFWGAGTKQTAEDIGFLSDYCRGMKQGQPFITMESAPGINIGGMNFKKVKSNGQQLLEAVKMVAHGSDSILYFQWRKGRGAWEKFHGAVVDHYGKEDTRVFQNVSKVGEILQKLDGVVGTGVKSDVAITFDMETLWALNGSAATGGWSDDYNGYRKCAAAFYSAFYESNIPTDVIGYEDDFSKYKVVVLTVPYLMTKSLADKLKNYVKGGGILISTYLTAVADSTDLCYLGGVPGAGLSDLFGLRVDEVDSYQNPSVDGLHHNCKNAVSYSGKTYPLSGIAEIIVPQTAHAVAHYTGDFYAGTGALFENSFGAGKAYYMGFEQEGELQKALVKTLIAELGLNAPMNITCDSGVCIRKREGDGENYYFVMNESDEEKNITLDKTYRNVLTGEAVSGKQTLPDCGFFILTDS